MKLALNMKTALTQTLTPQQIQYLKLLQLPMVQLEQHVRQEIEQNPMLDEVSDPESVLGNEEEFDDNYREKSADPEIDDDAKRDFLEKEDADPFEFYKLLWDNHHATSGAGAAQSYQRDDDDGEPYRYGSTESFIENLTGQLRMLEMSEEEFILGEHIIGNIDGDGYLRRELSEIVDETNAVIAELNLNIKKEKKKIEEAEQDPFENPARKFAIGYGGELIEDEVEGVIDFSSAGSLYLKQVDLKTAEKVLAQVQSLDPPGVGSRNLQECLIAQCKSVPKPNAAQKLALKILEEAYEPFAMKHYKAIIKQLGITEDYLKEAIDVIRRLNPKPGAEDYAEQINTVIPDFTIVRDDENDDLKILVNDSRLPTLHLNKAYQKLKKEAKYKLFNKETKEWIRTKYDDAKFLIQAIRQRKNTMLKVMTAIAQLQREFFFKGYSALRPLIYKDVAEETGLDISTVCRIVNGKYAQTQYGTYELKYFFSEALPNSDGEEVSTTVIKRIIKDIVDDESKKKPLSDEKISAILTEKGYNVARRTVAKYREQMKIPVARLRKEL